MAFAHFPAERLGDLFEASITLQYADPDMRLALLGGVNPGYVAALPSIRRPDAQLLLDLHRMNGEERLSDGSVPIEGWLRNASLLGQPRPEAGVFDDALDDLLERIQPEARTLVPAPELEQHLTGFLAETADAANVSVLHNVPRGRSAPDDDLCALNAFLLGLNLWGLRIAASQELGVDLERRIAADLAEYVRFFADALDDITIDAEAVAGHVELDFDRLLTDIAGRLALRWGGAVVAALRAAAWVMLTVVTADAEQRDGALGRLRREHRPGDIDDGTIDRLEAAFQAPKADRAPGAQAEYDASLAYVFDVLMGGRMGPLPARDGRPAPDRRATGVIAFRLGASLADADGAEVAALSGSFPEVFEDIELDERGVRDLVEDPSSTFRRLQVHYGRPIALAFWLGYHVVARGRAESSIAQRIAAVEVATAAAQLGLQPAPQEGLDPADQEGFDRPRPQQDQRHYEHALGHIKPPRPLWQHPGVIGAVVVVALGLAVWALVGNPEPEAVCGDGVRAGGEACDDGNNRTETCGPGERQCEVCAADCTIQRVVVDTPTPDAAPRDAGTDRTEPVEVGGLDAAQPDASLPDAEPRDALPPRAQCGDSRVDREAGEECDDGNRELEACEYGQRRCRVCGPDCRVVATRGPFCGDRRIDEDAGEQCDDGNNRTEDDCPDDSRSCTICTADCALLRLDAAVPEPRCGDGRVDREAGEACDDANVVTEVCEYGQRRCRVCAADCTIERGRTMYCGDGRVDEDFGERCDTRGDSDACDVNCTEPVCGDGHLNPEAHEACDDGNLDAGDGCSRCRPERGWQCEGVRGDRRVTSVCRQVDEGSNDEPDAGRFERIDLGIHLEWMPGIPDLGGIIEAPVNWTPPVRGEPVEGPP